MYRRAFLGASAGAASWLSEGCSRRASAKAAKVRVSARPYLYMAPFFLAHELGYFHDAGLDIELHTLNDGYETISLLAGGKLDVAFSALTASMVTAVAKGGQVAVVAGRRRLTPNCSDSGTIYGKRSVFPRGLATLSDVKREIRGKRIAINSRSSVNEFYLDTMLEKAGLRAGDVKTDVIRFPAAVAAVMSGHVDAFLAPEQFGTQPVSDSPRLVRGMAMAEILRNFQYSYVLFGQGLLHADLQIGAKFLGAYLRATQEFVDGKTPKFMDEFAQSNGFDVVRARDSCRGHETPDGTISHESVRMMAEWFLRKHYSPAPVTVDRIVDERFLDRVRREKT
jgi:ABC-type nitrate/sulfonate/bicarbonate transport system substrate-binding protein